MVQANIVKARPDDLLNWDRRLDQPMPRGSLPQQLADPRLPENQRAGTRAELRDIKLEQIGGRWLPVKGVLRSEETFKAGRPFKASKAITQRFDLAPDFVALGAFELDVPEGTRVFIGNGDEPQDGIRLEWRGGKVVPVADQEKLSRLEREISAYRKPRAGGAISNVP